MKNFFSYFPALLIPLLVLIVTGQALASGLVLCVGDGGHTAIEQSLAGKCAPAAEPPCPTEEQSCAACAHDYGDPCRDFPTTSDSLHGRFRGDQDPGPLLPAIVSLPPSPTLAVFPRDLPTKLYPLPPPHSRTALLALRTVVLLN